MISVSDMETVREIQEQLPLTFRPLLVQYCLVLNCAPISAFLATLAAVAVVVKLSVIEN